MIDENEIDRLLYLLRKLEYEEDIPAKKAAMRLDILKNASMLADMIEMGRHEDTKEEAQYRFNITGQRRDYGKERQDIIKFGELLLRQVEQYYS